MSGVICEPRIAVMILVKASWENEAGMLQTVPARIEDRSSGGACLRLKARVGVGSKLNVEGRNEQFSGIARYCRRDGMDYLVGVQRQPMVSPIPTQAAPVATSLQQDPKPGEGSQESNESAPAKIAMNEPSDATQEMKPSLLVQIATFAAAPVVNPDAPKPAVSQLQNLNVQEHAEPLIHQAPDETGTSKPRKPMRKRLLELAHWHNKRDDAPSSTNGNASSADEKRKLVPQPESHPAVKDGVTTSLVDLLPTDEIYRAAGITNLRREYSINKVIEMLRSEHLRGLSKEMRRAAVLMALDAAGIPIDELRQDAIARQAALDAYENEQRIRVEAEWARKAEENVQIEAELERIKTHYMARISRNQDGVTREKAAFCNWLEGKQQVSQSIAEAVELCLSPMVSQPVAGPILEISKASAKTM